MEELELRVQKNESSLKEVLVEVAEHLHEPQIGVHDKSQAKIERHLTRVIEKKLT